MSSAIQSLLGTMGLGGQSPADSAKDASALAAQKSLALGGLSTSLSSANLALASAQSMGVPASSLGPIQKVVKDGNIIMSQAATLSPDQLVKKVNDYSVKVTTTMMAKHQTDYKNGLKDIVNIQTTIRKRVNTIRADKTISSGLLSQYDSLMKEIDSTVDTWRINTPQKFYAEQAEMDPSDSTKNTPYSLPNTPTKAEYQDKLDELDNEYDSETGANAPLTRVYRRFKQWWAVYVYYSFYMLVVFCSIILGGIITSNMFIESEKNYLPGRAFYFIYGAIGFPLSLSFAALWKTPFWNAGLFPAYIRTQPVPMAGGAGAAKTSLGASFSLLAAAQPTIGPDAAAKKLLNLPYAVDKSKPSTTIMRADDMSNITNLPPTTLGERLFSYGAIDTSNPEQYQIDARNQLWVLSTISLVSLLGFVFTK
jgi:hypothetical protein